MEWLEILASLELISKSFSILDTAFLRERESGWERRMEEESKRNGDRDRERKYKLKFQKL